MKLLRSKAMLNAAKALCVAFMLVFGLMMAASSVMFAWPGQVSAFLNQPTQRYEMAEGYELPINPDTGEPWDPEDYPTLGVKDPDYPWYYKPKFDSLKELKKGKTLEDGTKLRGTSAISEQIVAEGATLLYNKSNALPLTASERKVSLFSVGSIRAFYGAQGAHGVAGSANTYTGWFRYDDAYTKAGFEINRFLWDEYMRLHGDPNVQTGDTGTGATTPYRRNRSNNAVTQKFGDVAWTDHTGPQGKALQGIYSNRTRTVDGVTKQIDKSIEEYGDAAIFNWTRQNGENADLMPGAYGTNEQTFLDGNSGYDSCKLTDKERSTVTGLAGLRKAGTIKKFIIIVNSNNILAMDFMKDANIAPYVDAIIWIGGFGENGIYAVPKLLSGEYNFSGSLPVTAFYNNYDIPAVANLNTGDGSASSLDGQNFIFEGAPGTTANRNAYVVYQEGIYVGYRYPETRYEDVVGSRARTGNFKYGDTVYATFGTGLSYTSFSFSNFSASRRDGGSNGDKYTVSVRVTNTGSKAGKKAVQIYGQKPYTQNCIDNEIEVPAIELVGFAKTKMLQAGAYEDITVEVDGKYLAAYDFMKEKTYVQNSGAHYLAVGNNAHDALNNILARKGYTTTNGMDYNGNRNLSWSVNLPFSASKYAHASNTGERISNLFDDANWNLYKNKGDGEVKYVSRSDWEGTLSFFKFVPGNATSDNPAGNPNANEYYSKATASGAVPRLKWNSKIREDEDENFAVEPGDDGIKYPTYGAKYSEGNPYILPNQEKITKQVSLVDLMYDSEGKWVSYDDPLWDALLDQMSWDETCRLVRNGQRHTEPVASINKPQTFEYNESNGLVGGWIPSTAGFVKNKALAESLNDPDARQHGSPSDPDTFATGMAELWPCNPVMTATMNVDLMYECGLVWGEEGMWAGFSGLYGVGANILRTPYGSRHHEYFSEDPIAGGTICAYLVGGMQAMGMNNVIKHFFLNESDTHRIGTTIWATEQTMREIYLRMFEIPIAIKTVTLDGYGEVTVGGAMNTMGSKGRIGPYMVVAYEPLMTGWLRNEAGLRGFSTTDMPEGGGINSKAAQVKAGCTLSDSNDTLNTIFDPYATGHGEFAWKLREAAKRNMYHVLHSNGMNGFTAGTRVIALTPAWIGVVNALNITTGILFGLSFLFLIFVVALRMLNERSNRRYSHEQN